MVRTVQQSLHKLEYFTQFFTDYGRVTKNAKRISDEGEWESKTKSASEEAIRSNKCHKKLFGEKPWTGCEGTWGMILLSKLMLSVTFMKKLLNKPLWVSWKADLKKLL